MDKVYTPLERDVKFVQAALEFEPFRVIEISSDFLNAVKSVLASQKALSSQNAKFREALERIKSSPVYNHYDRKPNDSGEFTNTHTHCGECLDKKAIALVAIEELEK